MQKVRQILVPVDFQQHTEELVEFALDMAAKLEAKAMFFHVVESLVFYSDFVPTNYALNEEETFSFANNKMNELVETSKTRWKECQGQVIRGDVVESILKCAQDEAADLIIMATHGAKGIEKILLGSVAERVIKRAKCPVLVFKSTKPR